MISPSWPPLSPVYEFLRHVPLVYGVCVFLPHSQPCVNDDRMEAEMPVGNHPAAPAAGPSSGQQQAMQASVAGGSSNNKVYAEVSG